MLGDVAHENRVWKRTRMEWRHKGEENHSEERKGKKKLNEKTDDEPSMRNH